MPVAFSALFFAQEKSVLFMMLHLPNIGNLKIFRLSACGTSENAEGFQQLVDYLEDREDALDVDAKYSADEWLHIRTSLHDGRPHLHLDLATDDYFIYEFGGRPEESIESVELEKIEEELKKFTDVSLDVDVSCYFAIDLIDLPKQGLVSSVLGLSTKLMGASLNLTGATMSIRDADFEELEWRLFGEDSDKVRAVIRFEKTLKFGSTYLETLVNHSKAGFDRFVLERKRHESTPKNVS